MEKDLDRSMENLRKRFKEDVEGAKSATLVVLEEQGKEIKTNSPWQPQFWHPRQTMINPENLERFLGGSEELKNKCPNLFKVISRPYHKSQSIKNIILD